MNELNSRNDFNDKNSRTSKTYNIINTNKYNNPYNTSFQKENLNTAHTTFNNTNQMIYSSNYDRYKNQQLLNRARTAHNTCNCSCHINSKSNINQRCNHCHLHHFHIHHIHLPTRQLYDYFNKNNITEISNLNNSVENSNNLLKEVIELRNECRKFKEELDKNNKEKRYEDNYVKDLEKKLDSQNTGDENPEKANSNKYQNMLDKSFGLLNSVSNKCNDEKGKMKGGVNFYMNKQPEYEQLIEAQKNWVENLPENNGISQNIASLNNSTNKTYSINDQNLNELNKNLDQIKGNNDAKNQKRHFFDSKRNNNKGYIIKRGEKIWNNDNYNHNNQEYNDYQGNNFNNEFNDLHNNLNNDYNKQQINPNQKNFNNPYTYVRENEDNKEKLNQDLSNNNPNNENENKFNNSDNANNNGEEEKNPINERYLIVDEKGNPILINDEKLLGMELIPLIGEDGKEVIDENGNIILVGPDGEPKSQNELEPIILDNDKPLVSKENIPFLGLMGVPLINGEGNPVLGPGELYDNENKRVEGVLGLVAKDKNGNPIKVEQKKNDIKKLNDGNNINIGENTEEIKPENINKYKNLKPLIGPDGFPLKDSNNQDILLDEKNAPVKDTGISLLLDQSGKPVLNSSGNPILLDKNGKPINADNNSPYQEISFNKPLMNKYRDLLPQRQNIKLDRYKMDSLNNNRLRNKRKINGDNNMKEKMNYSECNPESLKKINFMRPNRNPFYDDNEYKVNCFACNLGCGVSKSGYSPMNFSPYNNRIRRRDITPIGRNIGRNKKSKKSTKTNLKRINYKSNNNYYLTENK